MFATINLRPATAVVFPYDANLRRSLDSLPELRVRYGWAYRIRFSRSVAISATNVEERGLRWYEYQQFFRDRAAYVPHASPFAFVATHNHFVLDRGGKVFKQSAPVIKLPAGATEDDHLGLLGLLNSSTACFWMKQVFHNKGGQCRTRGSKGEQDALGRSIRIQWHTGLEQLSTRRVYTPIDLARALDSAAQRFAANLPAAICARAVPTREALDAARAEAESTRARMIALQEELDWRCYRLYGLLEDAPEHPDPPPLRLGERAFEIVMARRMAAGDLETAWFERHGSTPITELPAHWPDDYRAVVERRIASDRVRRHHRPDRAARIQAPLVHAHLGGDGAGRSARLAARPAGGSALLAGRRPAHTLGAGARPTPPAVMQISSPSPRSSLAAPPST